MKAMTYFREMALDPLQHFLSALSFRKMCPGSVCAQDTSKPKLTGVISYLSLNLKWERCVTAWG